MQPSTKLPSPEAADPREVALALEEAIALAATGKREESIKALSRAADAADSAGMPARAVAIRAALVEVSGTPSPAPRGATGRPPPPSAMRAGSVAPRPPSGGPSHAPPPPSARAAAEARASSVAPAPAPSASMAPAPAPPAASASPPKAASSPAPAPAAHSSPPTASVAPPAAAVRPAAAVATSVDASAALAAAGASALHVWVRASARDPSLLLVRVLPAGHPAPPGSYEAFLRPAREDENLFAPKH